MTVHFGLVGSSRSSGNDPLTAGTTLIVQINPFYIYSKQTDMVTSLAT
jgi:hypothetical protein